MIPAEQLCAGCGRTLPMTAEFFSGCAVCGEKDMRVIDAHHVDPRTKDCSPNAWLQPDVLAAELAKCIPLCANHHKIVHCELRQGGNTEEIVARIKEGLTA